MHLKQIRIQNLLSFKDVEFRFDKYNVIVGHNNSGKTNLVRIFDFISKHTDFGDLRINKKMKFDQNLPSMIYLTITLSDKEAKSAFQIIFNKELSLKEYPKNVKDVEIILSWDNILTEGVNPNFMCYRFENGFTIIGNSDQNLVINSNIIYNNKEEFYKEIEDLKNLSSVKILDKFIKKYSLRDKPALGIDNSLIENFCQGHDLDKFFKIGATPYSTTVPLHIQFKNNDPNSISLEAVNLLGLQKNSQHNISFSRILCNLFKNNFISIEEIHPTYNELTIKLSNLKKFREDDYLKLRDEFGKIFTDTKIKVEGFKVDENSEKVERILVEENGRIFTLEETASGHYALIHVLHAILNRPNQILVIDEPEVHFHPIMISKLANTLQELSQSVNNQIIIISHSPKFVDFDLLHSKKSSILTLVRKEEEHSDVQSNSSDFTPKLKPHLFNPEIFFGKSTLIVEGSDDYFAMMAISDFYDKIFEKYNITLTHCWGKGNVPGFIEIHNKFKIQFVAMVDADYTGTMTNVIKLPVDLEDEYKKLGWSGSSKVQDDAYPFMEKFLNNGGLPELQKSKIWTSFAEIINKSGGKIPKK